jgi:hypothetical protein
VTAAQLKQAASIHILACVHPMLILAVLNNSQAALPDLPGPSLVVTAHLP